MKKKPGLEIAIMSGPKPDMGGSSNDGGPSEEKLRLTRAFTDALGVDPSDEDLPMVAQSFSDLYEQCMDEKYEEPEAEDDEEMELG